jgi:hypothetical protein
VVEGADLTGVAAYEGQERPLDKDALFPIIMPFGKYLLDEAKQNVL